jgi:predicted nucleic acid-binding Zn ribbon protein
MKPRKSGTPTSVGTVLNGIFARSGLAGSLSRYAILRAWPRIVGSQVARHAKAEKVAGATLYVAVDSAAWMNELAAIKNLLLDKLNAHIQREATPLADIRFSQRSWARAKKPEPAPPKPPRATEREMEAVNQMLEAVKDDKLKQMLKRILEKDRQLKWRRTHGEEGSRPNSGSPESD